jgi:prolyl-tRNA editing enzyme YbaK/EbsC (Cys-tRNA(Pro) deacylase)
MPVAKKKPAKRKVAPKKKPAKKVAKKKPTKKFAKKKPAKKVAKKKPTPPKRKLKPSSKRVLIHLGDKKVRFDIIPHRTVYTAYDLAQTLGEKLDDIAKTLLVEVELPKTPEIKRAGKAHYVVVLPASYRANLQKIKKALNAKKVVLATEKMMDKLGMEPGALTPFGSLRDFGVLVDKNLLKAKKVLVGAESFTESLRMTVKDLIKAEEAIVGPVGDKSKLKLQKPGPKTKGKGKKKSAMKPAKKKPAKKAPAKKKTVAKKRRR